MDTWERISTAFLNRFFPLSRTNAFRNQLLNFQQASGETMYEAWEQFNRLARGCPHHGIEPWSLLQIFYAGLGSTEKGLLDAAAGVVLVTKA